MLSDAYCQCAKFNVADKRLTLAMKFNYWCKWREKGNNTERRMTLDVDNLYLIDCHCSAVSVIHSVTLCYGSMWDCSVIMIMTHQLNWAELNYFSLNWKTNTSIMATVNYEWFIKHNAHSHFFALSYQKTSNSEKEPGSGTVFKTDTLKWERYKG